MFRSRQSKYLTQARNFAEFLCHLGRIVRRHARRGAGLEEIARAVHLCPATCELALAFLSSSDVLKLRAMVEGWSGARIIEELGFVPACLAPAGTPADGEQQDQQMMWGI